jgi:hypothetical protein
MASIIEALKSTEHLRAGGAATDIEIETAEKQLDLTFASEYKEYLKEFGFASCNGHELTGISKSSRLNVVDVTQEARETYGSDIQDMYVIEDTGYEGILVLQDRKGSVYQIEPNSKPSKICPSLAAYVQK